MREVTDEAGSTLIEEIEISRLNARIYKISNDFRKSSHYWYTKFKTKI